MEKFEIPAIGDSNDFEIQLKISLNICDQPLNFRDYSQVWRLQVK